MHEKLTADLRDWAGAARRQGQSESADLIAQAAEAVAAGTRDAELAAHLHAYAAIAESKGQHGFAGILTQAAETVS